jgi:hypothetical protein
VSLLPNLAVHYNSCPISISKVTMDDGHLICPHTSMSRKNTSCLTRDIKGMLGLSGSRRNPDGKKTQAAPADMGTSLKQVYNSAAISGSYKKVTPIEIILRSYPEKLS